MSVTNYVPFWMKQDFEKLYAEFQKFGSIPEEDESEVY